MTSKTLSEFFLIHWQAENPQGRIYRNNTGVAWYTNKDESLRPVAYGIPAPKIGKKPAKDADNKDKTKAKGGGGTDYIGFKPFVIPSNDGDFLNVNIHVTGVIIAEFYEIKTINDRISEDQKRFYRVITGMGGKINIVQELPNDKWEIVEWKE